ncbi:MAG: hypothetical protein HY271_06540 [Deltaproteobacteria bacterium]|nr:hypothetical protein [Deltaproteobacteria bacterium]
MNALAEKLVARVKRDGAEWEQSFSRGKATSALKKVGSARGSGTTIFFRPDAQIFPHTTFDAALIAERLEAKAYLHGGLTIDFHDERAGTKATYHYEDGLKAFLQKMVADGKQVPLAGEVFTLQAEQDDLHLDCALTWTEATDERVFSYVNGIPTTAGGAHENGFKSGLVKAVRNYLTVHNQIPRGQSIVAEDAREGLVAVLAVKLWQPQFQGQTKERLNNAEVTPLIDGLVRTALENALNANRTWGDIVGSRVVLAAKARSASRAAAQQVQRKGAVSHRLNLPGKLPTAARPTRASASCSSSRATPPAARPSRVASAGSRRSSRCAARCSTPSRRPRRRSSPTRSCRTSSPRSAAARARTSTRPSSATTRSACSWTPTPTATTSARCCSRSSTATSRS